NHGADTAVCQRLSGWPLGTQRNRGSNALYNFAGNSVFQTQWLFWYTRNGTGIIMAPNRWLATGNYFTSYREEQQIFFTSLDRTAMALLIAALFTWPLFFDVGNKYMLIIDNILVAVIAVMGLNLVTGFAGLISIGHAAFVGIGAYTIASFSRTLGDSHLLLTHAWPVMILLAGGMGAIFGAIVGLPALRLKHLYLAIATLSFQMI